MGAIEDACGRIQHLVSSGYLPDSLKRDLQVLTQAAISWDSHLKLASANNTEDIPAVLKEPRKAKDLSQAEPARPAGAAQPRLKRIEDSRAKPFTIPPAIAKALGMSIDQV